MEYHLTDDNKDEILEKVLSDTADFISVCQSFGYTATYPFFQRFSSSKREGKSLQLEFYVDRNSYYPEIHYKGGDSFGYITDYAQIKFCANPASFGALSCDEFEKFVNAQNKALQLLQWLNNYKGWDKFPVVIFDK